MSRFNPAEVWDAMKPFALADVSRLITGGSGTAEAGGALSPSDYPDALLRDGSRSLLGNLAAGAGVTIDGVDISAFRSDYDAHLSGDSHPIYALDATIFAAGAGLTGGGNLGADRTFDVGQGVGLVVNANDVALGTPTAVSISTINSVSGTTHAHQVIYTTSGAANALVATDANGNIFASGNLYTGNTTGTSAIANPMRLDGFGDDLYVVNAANDVAGRGRIHFRTRGETIEHYTFDGPTLTIREGVANYATLGVNSLGNLAIAPSGPLATLPATVRLQSTNYASQTTGWGIDGPTGGGDFRYLFADEMHVRLFIADLEQALAGGQIIGKSVAVLASAFTAPAIPTSFLTVTRRGQTTATGQGGPQTITLVNTSSTSFASSSGSVNIPSGTADGDFMLLGVYFWNGETLTTPSGWTQVRTLSESSTGMTLRIFRRVASSEGASVGLTFSGSLEASAAIITTRGVDTSNPIIDEDGSDNGTGTSMSTPALDVGSVTGSFLVFFGGAERQNATPSATANGNLVERVDQSHTTGEFRELIYVATEAYAGTGSTGTRSATLVASLTNQAAMIALRPGNGGNTSVSASPPASTAQNDLMLASVCYAGGTLTMPSGWTLLESVAGLGIYYRLAGASEGNSTWSLSNASGMSVHVIGYYNVDVGSPIGDSEIQTNASSTNMVAPSVNAPVASGHLVFIGATALGVPTSTAPGGMTERTDAGGNGTMITIADQAISASGSTGTRTATLSSAFGNAAALIALRPAPNGGQTTLVVRDLPSAPNMAVFEAGDIVRVPEYSRSAGTLTVAACWGSVAGYTDNSDGTQAWTFTRSSAPNGGAMSAGTVIQPDAIILDYGVSGNGYYEVNAVDGAYGINSPYAQFVTWTGHPATGRVVRMRSGHLRGIFGVNNEFGLFAGSGVTDADQYLRLSNSAARLNNVPIQLYNSGTQTVNFSSTGTDVWVGVSTSDRRLSWNGTTLSVVGSITVTGGNAATTGYVDGVNKDWTTQITNRPMDNAGRVITAPSPGVAGLFLGSTHMGYHDGTNWRTYMANSGVFVFRGSNARIEWNGTQLSGYDAAASGTAQWQTDATTGEIVAAAGAWRLGASGLRIDRGSNTERQIRWANGGTTVASIWSQAVDVYNYLFLSAADGNGASTDVVAVTNSMFIAEGAAQFDSTVAIAGTATFSGLANFIGSQFSNANAILTYGATGGGRSVVSIGDISTDYAPTAGKWSSGNDTSNATLLLNAANYSVIGFHDSGARVDFIRVGQGVMTLGYDGGWGTARVDVPGTLGETWSSLSYNTGWSTISGYNAAQYKRVGDLVFVRGTVQRTSGSATVIATLPSGYRPVNRTILGTVGGGDAVARVDIRTNGDIDVIAGSTSYIALDGIVFSLL